MDVKWIKITTDIFDDEKINIIESLPEGDTIIVIWFKLLCLAGKSNNSGVFMMNNKIPYTSAMFSSIFHRKEVSIQLALATFENLGMIEIIDNVVTLSNWDKHQSLDAYEKKKAYDRERQSRIREEKKALINKDSDNNRTIIVRDCSYSISISNIINYLNNKINSNYKDTTDKTRKLIIARLKEGFTEDDFYKVIDTKAEQWLKKPDMRIYLRPETLFGTKFEGYLNETPKVEYTPNKKERQ